MVKLQLRNAKHEEWIDKGLRLVDQYSPIANQAYTKPWFCKAFLDLIQAIGNIWTYEDRLRQGNCKCDTDGAGARM